MDFNTLAFSPLNRMNEVIRYSSVHQESEETLAEHVTEVSMMSYLIAKYIMKNSTEKFDIGKLLEKCLIHDADEVLTGDIPRNTKYATKEAHDQLNIVAEEAINMIEKLSSGVEIKDIWSSAKSSKEGAILKIVDMLVVVKKAITEIELRGNLTFLKVVTELDGHLDNMIKNLPSYRKLFKDEFTLDYLTSLVSEAKDEIVTIRVKYGHIIKKYSIRENVIKGE